MYPLTSWCKKWEYDPRSYGCTTHGLELSAGPRGRAWGVRRECLPNFFRNWLLLIVAQIWKQNLRYDCKKQCYWERRYPDRPCSGGDRGGSDKASCCCPPLSLLIQYDRRQALLETVGHRDFGVILSGWASQWTIPLYVYRYYRHTYTFFSHLIGGPRPPRPPWLRHWNGVYWKLHVNIGLIKTT